MIQEGLATESQFTRSGSLISPGAIQSLFKQLDFQESMGFFPAPENSELSLRFKGQLFRPDSSTLCGQQGILNSPAKFPDISFPCVPEKRLVSLGTPAGCAQTMFPYRPSCKHIPQKENIPSPVP